MLLVFVERMSHIIENPLHKLLEECPIVDGLIKLSEVNINYILLLPVKKVS